MIDKIIDLKQQHEIERKLRQDAKLLDHNISLQLKTDLLSKLATQNIQNKVQNNPLSFYAFGRHKAAIAASLLLSVLAVQLFINEEKNNHIPSYTSQENANNQDEITMKFPVDFFNKNLIASNHLRTEYTAIMSDIEKLKNSLIKL